MKKNWMAVGVVIIIFLSVCVILFVIKDSDGLNNLSQDRTQEFNTDILVNQWVSMWNTYDLAMVDSLFLLSERATYYSSEKEGLLVGIDAIREHHKSFGFVEGGKVQGNRLWVEDILAGWYGPVIVVTGTWFFQKPSDASGEVQYGPMTLIYTKTNGEYRIAHMHFANYGE